MKSCQPYRQVPELKTLKKGSSLQKVGVESRRRAPVFESRDVNIYFWVCMCLVMDVLGKVLRSAGPRRHGSALWGWRLSVAVGTGREDSPPVRKQWEGTAGRWS